MRRRTMWSAWKERSARGVNFGWGMLAHIYPGGKLEMDQTNAGGGRWIFTDFSMQLSVRALMVKTLNIRSSAKASGFQTLGPMSYQDAIHGCCWRRRCRTDRSVQAVTRAFAWSVWRRTVRASMRSRCTSKPRPTAVGTTISPLGLTVTAGSMMSWVQ